MLKQTQFLIKSWPEKIQSNFLTSVSAGAVSSLSLLCILILETRERLSCGWAASAGYDRPDQKNRSDVWFPSEQRNKESWAEEQASFRRNSIESE